MKVLEGLFDKLSELLEGEEELGILEWGWIGWVSLSENGVDLLMDHGFGQKNKRLTLQRLKCGTGCAEDFIERGSSIYDIWGTLYPCPEGFLLLIF